MTTCAVSPYVFSCAVKANPLVEWDQYENLDESATVIWSELMWNFNETLNTVKEEVLVSHVDAVKSNLKGLSEQADACKFVVAPEIRSDGDKLVAKMVRMSSTQLILRACASAKDGLGLREDVTRKVQPRLRESRVVPKDLHGPVAAAYMAGLNMEMPS